MIRAEKQGRGGNENSDGGNSGNSRDGKRRRLRDK